MKYEFEPIGIVHSCFKEKFGIPRQPGLVSEARALVEILPPYNQPEAFRGLEGFSHLWLVFLFHKNMEKGWRPTVRPPRLGGNRRLGVFATRSTFRPNPFGLSAVELERVSIEGNDIKIHLRGADILDQTPVMDIKPYLPYSDNVSGAEAGFAPESPPRLEVEFSPESLKICREREAGELPYLSRLIVQTLCRDPRPAYFARSGRDRVFGIRLLDMDIKWQVIEDKVHIIDIDIIKE